MDTASWGGWIRTNGWRNQNPLPCRLATPHFSRLAFIHILVYKICEKRLQIYWFLFFDANLFCKQSTFYRNGYFSSSALATFSGTKPLTLCPCRANSRMIDELRYVYFSCGIKKVVVMEGAIFRFIRAI